MESISEESCSIQQLPPLIIAPVLLLELNGKYTTEYNVVLQRLKASIFTLILSWDFESFDLLIGD